MMPVLFHMSDSESVLPSHKPQECLAYHFVTYFSDKITKIRDSFSSTDSFTLPAILGVPKLDFFKTVLMKKFIRQS